MTKFLLSAALVLICSFDAFSQAEGITDSTKIITMNNGDVRIGVIISDDGRELLISTLDIGKIYLRKQDIKNIKPYNPEAGEIVDGDFLANSPFTTRYYFTTNARPLKKGEDYVMIHLYGPEVHFSVNERFSIGIMTTWIASPFVLAGKYSIPTKNPNVNFGIGTLLGTSGYLNTFRGFGGLHWGMATFGDERQNVTVSLGYSYMNPGDYNSPRLVTAPVLSFAGIKKIGKRASFFFDSMIFFGSKKEKTYSSYNYTYNPITGMYDYMWTTSTNSYKNTIAFFMPGMRFQSGPKSAFQFALAGVIYSERNVTNNTSDVTAFPVPQCSWFIKF